MAINDAGDWLFGTPNSILGILVFATVAIFGVIALAGVRPPRWAIVLLALGIAFGATWAAWLAVRRPLMRGELVVARLAQLCSFRLKLEDGPVLAVGGSSGLHHVGGRFERRRAGPDDVNHRRERFGRA